jgi:hypothetical protein
MRAHTKQKREFQESHRERLRVLQVINDTSRQEVLKLFPPGSCIVSARVVIEVLNRFGIRARPVGASVIVVNDRFVDRLQSRGWPADRATAWRWRRDHGAISLAIGRRPGRREDAPAHVVVVATMGADSYLLDPALDQLNQLGQCRLEPLLSRLDTTFFADRDPHHVAALNDEWLAIYQPDFADRSWEATPLWEEWRIPTQEVLRRVPHVESF